MTPPWGNTFLFSAPQQLADENCTKMDRLTKIRGGCVCYAAFFDVNGAPTAPQAYPEDQIWYALTNEEQESIRHAKWSRGDHDHARPDYWPTARSFLRASE